MRAGKLRRMNLLITLMILVSCEGSSISDIDNRVIAVIIINPPSPTIVGIGNTIQLSATAIDIKGEPVNSAIFVWSSFNEPVATVNSNGLVTSVSAGSAIIDALIPGVAVTAGTANVTVVAVGEDISENR